MKCDDSVFVLEEARTATGLRVRLITGQLGLVRPNGSWIALKPGSGLPLSYDDVLKFKDSSLSIVDLRVIASPPFEEDAAFFDSVGTAPMEIDDDNFAAVQPEEGHFMDVDTQPLELSLNVPTQPLNLSLSLGENLPDIEDSGAPKNFVLTATYVARYFHLGSCKRYLFRTCQRPPKAEVLPNDKGKEEEEEADDEERDAKILTYGEAMLRKGEEFESELRKRLQKEPLLNLSDHLRDTNHNIFNILWNFATKKHREQDPENPKKIWASSISFWPGDLGFERVMCASDNRFFRVGKMEIDFMELTILDDGTLEISIIDAKHSRKMKTYHIVQVVYYAIALEWMLSLPNIQQSLHGKVAISSHGRIFLPDTSTFYRTQSFQIDLVKPRVLSFLREDVPNILNPAFEESDWKSWHFQQGCQSCKHKESCREDAKGLVMSIPYLSSVDYHSLLLLANDVDSLWEMVQKDGQLSYSNSFGTPHRPVLIKALNLSLGENKTSVSPILEALKFQRTVPLQRSCFLLSKEETHYIILSLVQNPEDELLFWGLYDVALKDAFHYGETSDQLGNSLYGSLQAATGRCVQVVVYQENELNLLTEIALAEALCNSVLSAKWREILTALSLDARLLLLEPPPEVMVNTGEVGSVKEHELDQFIVKMGAVPRGDSAQKAKQLQKLLDERRAKWLRCPGMIAVHALIRQSVSTYQPGYFRFAEAVDMLLDEEEKSAETSDLEAIYALLSAASESNLVIEAMKGRLKLVRHLTEKIRTAIPQKFRNGFLPESPRLGNIDTSKRILLGKLSFLKEYEAIVAMQKLREERVTGRGVVIELRALGNRMEKNGKIYRFQVESGLEHLQWQDEEEEEEEEGGGVKKKKKAKAMSYSSYILTPRAVSGIKLPGRGDEVHRFWYDFFFFFFLNSFTEKVTQISNKKKKQKKK